VHTLQRCGLVTDVPWSLCLSVCLLDITLSCAKTAELIRMPFGVWTRVAQGTVDYLGALTTQEEGVLVGGHLPAMRPFVKIL